MSWWMSINFLELEVSQVCPKIGKMEILYNIKQQLGLNYWGRMAFRRVVKKGLWPQHIIRASEEKKIDEYHLFHSSYTLSFKNESF